MHEPSSVLRRFLDRQERVSVWPSKRKDQQVVLEYLAAKFEPGVEYSEREVNQILKRFHTFGDHALLRRYLFDYGYFDRERNGTRYRLAQQELARSGE